MRRLLIVGMGREQNPARVLQKGIVSSSSLIAVYRLTEGPEGIEKGLPGSGNEIIFLEEIERSQPGLSLIELRKKMAEEILGSVEDGGEVACLLPGRPWPGDGLYLELLAQTGGDAWTVDIFPGEDLSSPVLEFLQKNNPGINFSRGVTWIDSLNLGELREPPRGELLLTHSGSRYVLRCACEVLRTLYPSHHPIDILRLDEKGLLCHSATVLLQDLGNEDDPGFLILRVPPRPYYYLGDMVYLLGELRSPEGCPWDREQDHQSLKPYLLEESYEVLDAIDGGDHLALCEELGDLLLQIVFHSQLAAEKDIFYLWQVIDGISRKIYRRHPHVFQGEKARDTQDVAVIWQQAKDQERGGAKKDRFALPASFPALFRAQKIQKKVSQLGFDWPDARGAVEKLFEELEEFSQALESGQKENIAEELGDLFFSLVNVARFVGVEAEIVLGDATEKFIRRFRYVDAQVQKRGGDYRCFTLEELDVWWDEAKKL
ncbi:MAG TPA: nucleoside triphosphate pyrophosphohydrolase [Firmicutes bacterium]|jgi:tetrapyrrole methylase family protein/MazG family protein|nr:nucleoside triphosphate pyrophosphohydrolase [Bacillota bacterium]